MTARVLPPTWRCGHPRTPTACCPVCKARLNAARKLAKRPKRPRYIYAMTDVQLAEARALYNRALGLETAGVPDSTDPAQEAFPL